MKVIYDLRSEFPIEAIGIKKPEKKIRASTGFEPVKIHCEDHISPSYISAVHIWIISYTLHHFTPFTGKYELTIDLAPNVWLHSSVGRASHRYRGGHGFESR